MKRIKRALEIRNQLKNNGFTVDMGLSNAGTLFLRVLMHGKTLRHDWIAQIKNLLGVKLTKNRTPSNRLTYLAEVDGFRVYISTNQPYCGEHATYCEIVTPRKKSFYTCPDDTTEAQKQ